MRGAATAPASAPNPRHLRLNLVVGAAVCIAGGCQLVAAFDPEELRCPCTEGFVCVEDRCRSVEAGEDSRATCRDGEDNDDDGAADCLDTDCIDAGLCSPFSTECDPISSDGCPAGLSCSLSRAADGQIETVCRFPGSRHIGEWCERSGEPHETCLPQAACVIPGANVDALCLRLCRTDQDCDSDALCAIEIEELSLGLCTTPCLPWAPIVNCPGGYACRPVYVEESEGRTEGGSVTSCLQPDVTPGFGTATEGSACDPLDMDRTALCSEELFCAPIAGRRFCVRYCDPNSLAQPLGCEPCRALYVLSSEVRAPNGSTVGVCYGDAVD